MKNAEIKVHVVDYGRECLYMRYRDPLSKKQIARSTGTDDQAKALKAAGKWEDELRNGRYKAPSKVTWPEFRLRYEMEVLSGLAGATQTQAAAVFNAVERHLNPERLSELTADRISSFTMKEREAEWTHDHTSGKRPKNSGAAKSKAKKKRGLSEATIKGKLAYLMAALRWAHSMGLLIEVPKVEKPKRARKSTRTTPMKGRPITGEEFERMLTAVPDVVTEQPEGKEKRAGETEADRERIQSWRRHLRGLWLSGLRLEESLELWWDREDKLSIDLTGKYPMLRIPAELEKGNTDRLLPITPEFAEFLAATAEAERTGPVFNPKAQRERGSRLGADRVGKVIGQIGEKAGVKVQTDARTGKVKYASAHDLRRSFGERWAALVMPPILQQLMRHESIDTTLRFYVGRNAANTAEAVWKAVGRVGNTSGNFAHSERKRVTNAVAANVYAE